MLSQEEMDAVLKDAQQAVSELSEEVAGMGQEAEAATAAAVEPPPPEAVASVAPGPELNRLPSSVQRILKLKVPLLVRVASRGMSISDILKMSPGTILEFERTVDEELDLMINNCCIGSGTAVKVGEHFGLRINRIGNVRQRIDSMKGQHS